MPTVTPRVNVVLKEPIKEPIYDSVRSLAKGDLDVALHVPDLVVRVDDRAVGVAATVEQRVDVLDEDKKIYSLSR